MSRTSSKESVKSETNKTKNAMRLLADRCRVLLLLLRPFDSRFSKNCVDFVNVIAIRGARELREHDGVANGAQVQILKKMVLLNEFLEPLPSHTTKHVVKQNNVFIG